MLRRGKVIGVDANGIAHRLIVNEDRAD